MMFQDLTVPCGTVHMGIDLGRRKALMSEHFLDHAQELLYQEEQLLRSLESYKSGESGRLVIGISPFRSLYMIPDVVRQVREKYPDVPQQDRFELIEE